MPRPRAATAAAMKRGKPIKRRKPMKRGGALSRGKPMKRRPMRPSPEKSAYRARERDTAYMVWVKTLPCCARTDLGMDDCQGAIEADHAGTRGMGRKAQDDTCIPLCWYHHYGSRGAILDALSERGESMRSWLDRMITETRARWPADPLAGL